MSPPTKRGQQGSNNRLVDMAPQPVNCTRQFLSTPPGLAPPPGRAAQMPGMPQMPVRRPPNEVIAARAAAESQLAAFVAASLPLAAAAAPSPSAALLADSNKIRMGTPTNPTANGNGPAKAITAPPTCRKAAGKGPGGRAPRAPVPQWHPCYKKKLCMWFQDGLCRNGETCHFAHGAEELRAATSGSLPNCSSSSTPTPSNYFGSQAWDRTTTADSLGSVDSSSGSEPMKIDLESTWQMEAASRAQLLNAITTDLTSRQMKTVHAEPESALPHSLLSAMPALEAGNGQLQSQEMIRMLMMHEVMQQKSQMSHQMPSPMLTDLEKLKATVQFLSLKCQQIQQQMMVAPPGYPGTQGHY
jgi:hypothetical protein